MVFQRGNVEALAACMMRLLRDPLLEMELRQAATAHLAAHMPGVVAEKYLEEIKRANQ
jgi:hypothetical protein